MLELEKEKKMTKIIRELIEGKSVSDIPKSQFQDTKQALLDAKQAAIENGQVERLKKLQNILSDIMKYEKTMKIRAPKKKARRNSSFAAPKTLVKEVPKEVLSSVLDDLANGFPFEIAETYLLPGLITESKEKADQMIEQGEYMEAQKYEDIHNRLVRILGQRNIEERETNKHASVTNQLNTAKVSLARTEDEFKSTLEKFDEKHKQAVVSLKQEYDIIISNFDAETSAGLPESQKKWSSYLLSLRDTEQSLLKSRRFEEAAKIKEEADNRALEELEQLEIKFAQSRAFARRKLLEEKNTKLQCLDEKYMGRRQKIVLEYEKDIECQRKVILNISAKIDPTRAPNSTRGHLTSRTFVTQRSNRMSLKAPTLIKKSQSETKIRASRLIRSRIARPYKN